MADRPEMFGPTRGFLGTANSMEPCQMLWADPCCHGNEIWARHGDPVPFWLVINLSLGHPPVGKWPLWLGHPQNRWTDHWPTIHQSVTWSSTGWKMATLTGSSTEQMDWPLTNHARSRESMETISHLCTISSDATVPFADDNTRHSSDSTGKMYNNNNTNSVALQWGNVVSFHSTFTTD